MRYGRTCAERIRTTPRKRWMRWRTSSHHLLNANEAAERRLVCVERWLLRAGCLRRAEVRDALVRCCGLRREILERRRVLLVILARLAAGRIRLADAVRRLRWHRSAAGLRALRRRRNDDGHGHQRRRHTHEDLPHSPSFVVAPRHYARLRRRDLSMGVNDPD